MKQIKYFVLAACLSSTLVGRAQTSDGAMTVDDLAAWQRISQQAISDDGRWVACRMEPWEGDATVLLYAAQGGEVARFYPAKDFRFSASSRFLLVKEVPTVGTVDSLKLKKTKKDQMPMDRLVIHTVRGQRETIDSLRNYRLAASADWLAYQRGRKDSTLYVRSLDGTKQFTFPTVSAYQFASKSGRLTFTSNDSLQAGLYTFDPTEGQPKQIKAGRGEYRQVAFDEQGNRIAFLYCTAKDSAYKALSLYLSEQQTPAREIARRGDPAFPTQWVLSEHGELQFSRSGQRLYFGTAPEPRQADTTQLAEKRPNVQVWSWNEPVQYTVQEYNKERDRKKSYRAVYLLDAQKLIQLADETLPDFQSANDGDGSYGLLSTTKPYSLSSMWEGRTRSDYYTVQIESGRRKLLATADYGRYRLSPAGQYAYWYAETDSCWYTRSLADGTLFRLSTPQHFAAWDVLNDVPDYPRSYGAAGWTDQDESLLIYDPYDLWRFDPKGIQPPVNLTKNGRTEQRSYHQIQLDPEARTIDLKQPQLLVAFDERTKGYAYYSARLDGKSEPKKLIGGDYMLRTIQKAKQTDDVIYTIESYAQYPDLHHSTLAFKQSVRLTDGATQQQRFTWGTAELIRFTSLDGRPVEGVIYKPANFDPNKQYPLMVNFYEKNSETLHNFRMPEPHRSTIDYHYYNSRGYVVFNPDVHYRDGYPGESCYNCVMPGIYALIDAGYIDAKRIGASGHSWGGYQTAYLATRTNLFAAFESGAPVVNMFSAYGGIRWGSGLARSFQYEHTQSRLAGTPWSTPMRYFTNSALFTMDKVQTPILIMHNDSDGHVPWYQGIEFFVALKRLGKTCWMLNYPGEPHWPTKLPNKKDFQIRMSQFFDHYLKDAPMPKWMSEGVPAVDQPFELGY